MTSDLEDFGNDEEPSNFLDEPIKTVVAFKDQLTQPQKNLLLPLLAVLPTPEEEQLYGVDFDVAGEINRMIIACRAMQDHIMEGGRIKQSVTLREVKETTAAAGTMIAALVKHHKEVVNLGRMAAVEKATLKILKGMDRTDEFIEALETELEAIE